MSDKTNKPTQGTKDKHICLLLNELADVPARRTVVVLGVERGGTSMAAGLLRALGINMGDRAGLNHEDAMFLVDEEDKLRRRVQTRNRDNEVWGFKVPKASLHLPFYERTLRNPFYLVVYRNSLSVVDSWMQRGAGTAVDVLDRIATYQGAILEHIKTSKSPVLLLNYERAVSSEDAKNKVVEEIARFIGVELTEELRARAVGMMTGDGKGYVNLPEHYFLAETRPRKSDGAEIALQEIEPEARDDQGWVAHDKPRPQVRYALASGKNLPKSFWMEIDMDSEGLDLAANPLRVFFNFTGEYFPGHCARPAVRHGRNVFWVETSGKAQDFGFGPFSVPARLKVSARVFEADPGDAGQARAETTVQSKVASPARKSLLGRVIDKVRG